MSRGRRRTRRRAAALALLGGAVVIGAWSDARAQRVMHRVRFGETARSISLRYYGSKSHALLIKLANGIPPRTKKLTAGRHIRVPTAWTHTLRRRAPLTAVAKRYLGDGRRWTALAMLNNLSNGRRRLRKGARLLIPFNLSLRVTGRDTFTDLSQRFYGTKKYGWLIASYNFVRESRPAAGSRIEIPLGAPTLAPRVLEDLTHERLLRVSGNNSREDREGLQEANALLRRGQYWEVPLRLIRLVGVTHSSDTHMAEVFKLLAIAYVAVGQRELAVKAFREALLRNRGLTLDVVTTSPTVIRAFVDARASVRRAR